MNSSQINSNKSEIVKITKIIFLSEKNTKLENNKYIYKCVWNIQKLCKFNINNYNKYIFK